MASPRPNMFLKDLDALAKPLVSLRVSVGFFGLCAARLSPGFPTGWQTMNGFVFLDRQSRAWGPSLPVQCVQHVL